MRQGSQKRNRSISKSSRKSVITMLTKKNPEESFEQAKLPYFNPDHIRDAINDRVKE